MGLLKEFKQFALRGNVMDMAVGIIIGAAFTSVVQSLVRDVLMPPLGAVTGGMDFAALAITLPAAEGVTKPATINYGLFINALISFIIVAFAVFMLVKVMNMAKKKEEAAPAPPPKPSEEVVLLTQIRDALRAR